MTRAVDNSVTQPLSPTEQDVVHTASTRRDQCVCGETHPDDENIAPATVARVRAYLARHPGHQFAIDEETGIIAVIVAPAPNVSGPLQLVAQATNLCHLLNDIGAPTAESLS